MSLALSAPTEKNVPRRLALFGLALGLGTLAGIIWATFAADWAYWGFLELFLDPRAQIANLGFGLALGFLAGFVHIVRPCFIGAASAALPLVQSAQGQGGWLKTTAVLTFSMVLVTALWGAVVAAVGGAFAETVGSPQFMGDAMRTVLPIMGLVLLVIALGELGLVRRLLPDFQHALSPAAEIRLRTAGDRYREVALIGLGVAATFGIVCTRPTYLALLVYVAAVGSASYGALALGIYGVGLALSIALSALGLLQVSRSDRLMTWLAARQEAIHVAQGMLLAALGAIPIWFFFLRNVLGLR